MLPVLQTIKKLRHFLLFSHFGIKGEIIFLYLFVLHQIIKPLRSEMQCIGECGCFLKWLSWVAATGIKFSHAFRAPFFVSSFNLWYNNNHEIVRAFGGQAWQEMKLRCNISDLIIRKSWEGTKSWNTKRRGISQFTHGFCTKGKEKSMRLRHFPIYFGPFLLLFPLLFYIFVRICFWIRWNLLMQWS